MRKLVLTAMATLLSCSFAQAFWPEATDSSLEIGVGYRQDRLKWQTNADLNSNSSYYSSSSSDTTVESGIPVRLRSKLEWKNLSIWEIAVKGKYVTCDNVYLRACADYGWIVSGKNRDRDYIDISGFGDNGSTEFASSSSKARGNVYDVKLGVGYQFKTCDDTFAIAPVVGYAWQSQRIKDRHLNQSFNLPLNNDGTVINVDPAVARSYSSYDYYSFSSDYYSYDGDHSTYHTRWNGPFIGFDADYSLCCDWAIFGGYEYHFVQYHGKGKWGLRDDILGSFHQRSKNGWGHVFDIGVKWDFCDCWTLSLSGEFQWFQANHGRDRSKIDETSLGNVKVKRFVDIPTRKTEWNSSKVLLALGMDF